MLDIWFLDCLTCQSATHGSNRWQQQMAATQHMAAATHGSIMHAAAMQPSLTER